MVGYKHFSLPTIAASRILATKLATAFKKVSLPCCILLQGALGSGKTTLCREILHQLGCREIIKSPSYSLIESYDTPYFPVHHLDAYRLKSGEAQDLGLEDYLADEALLLIEWPNRIEQQLRADLKIDFTFDKEDKRLVEIHSLSARGEQINQNI